MKKNLYFFLLFCGVFTSGLGQSHDWRLTLSSGDTLSNVELMKVHGDSLAIVRDSTSQWMKVVLITEIRCVKESKVWETTKKYAMYTGIASACVSAVIIAISAHGTSNNGQFVSFEMDNTTAKILGVLIGAPIYGAFFGLLGAIVGGIVGIASASDDVYDLSQMNLNGKLATLQSILEKRRNN